MDVEANVAVSGTNRLSSMEAHPHSERHAVCPGVLHKDPLARYGGRHCIPGPRERHEKSVPLRVNLLAVSLLERGAEEPLMFRHDLSVPPVAEALQESGGAFDVGEEDGDRPGRQGLQN
jgi:hypothetical protein